MLECKINFNADEQELLRKLGLQKGGPAQKLLDKLVVDWNQKYVPFETGTLARSPYAVSDFGSGQVVYPGPYAHYLYYGEVYGPNIPIVDSDSGLIHWISPKGQKKHPTGKQLQYSTEMNALAGSHWFDRMKADHLNDIVKEVEGFVRTQQK